MAKKNILVVDDEKVVHLIFKTVLNQDYQLFFADNAQDGIDILSEHPIHLVLLDVNMPDISGIELLESIMIDSSLNRIPVIIVTAHISEEYEKKAKQFGAVEFLEKTKLFSEKENILKLVEKYATDKDVQTLSNFDYKLTFRNIMTVLLATSDKGDFIDTVRKLAEGLYRTFNIDSFSLWTMQNGEPENAFYLKDGVSKEPRPGKKISEPGLHAINETGKPYLDNKAKIDDDSEDDSHQHQPGLRSEIGIPLYEITNEDLSINRWQISRETKIYGFIHLKRDRVFSTKEYKMLTRFVIHAGAILFELYKADLSDKKSS
tara:strand:- start:26394 stop:27347 length:954 start_codon:yes stop_codon:yes gene_type:complete